MKFYNNNLDFTGSKYNNPYALIQKAGKSKRRKNSCKRNKTKRSKRYRKKT